MTLRTLVFNALSFGCLGLLGYAAIASTGEAGARKSQMQLPAVPLNIAVENIEDTGGVLRVALFNSQQGCDADDAVETRSIAVKARERVVLTFSQIKHGDYAVKVYHDVNKDRELDTNMLGVPQEDYGFSSDAEALFSQPSWDEAKFAFKSSNALEVIDIN